jgi:hypothetical protein
MHQPTGWHFLPTPANPTPSNADPPWQSQWQLCAKCSGLYFDGNEDKGYCAKDGRFHQPADLGFALQYNHGAGPAGADLNMRDQFRVCINCSTLVRTDQIIVPATSPTVIDNARHQLLASALVTEDNSHRSATQGVVMTSCDWSNFRLSWTPLIPGQRPQFDTIRYFNKAQNAWTDYVDSSPGYQIFSPASPWDAENPYAPAKIYEPHVCASWLEKPGCWIAIYTHAGQDPNAELPVVARFSVDLFNWSDEVAIFDPRRENAYGRWMHDPNDPNDHIVGYPGSVDNVKGFGYGAFPINRYTTFDDTSRTLNLVYVLSPSSPYQVQVMGTAIYLPDPIVPPITPTPPDT